MRSSRWDGNATGPRGWPLLRHRRHDQLAPWRTPRSGWHSSPLDQLRSPYRSGNKCHSPVLCPKCPDKPLMRRSARRATRRSGRSSSRIAPPGRGRRRGRRGPGQIPSVRPLVSPDRKVRSTLIRCCPVNVRRRYVPWPP